MRRVKTRALEALPGSLSEENCLSKRSAEGKGGSGELGRGGVVLRISKSSDML